jgi:hypothetical protein
MAAAHAICGSAGWPQRTLSAAVSDVPYEDPLAVSRLARHGPWIDGSGSVRPGTGCQPGVEPRSVNHGASVGALGDRGRIVMGVNVEVELLSLDRCELNVNGHLRADRRGCRVAEVDMDTEGLLAWVASKCRHARPLHQGDEIARGQDRRQVGEVL